MANEGLSEKQSLENQYQLIRKEGGFGLAALKAFQAGQVISELYWAGRQSSPSRWTVQCGGEEHAEPMPFDLRYVNHSCQPNVLFDVDAGLVRALNSINPDEELSFFYPSTEWDMREPVECHCGTPACLGLVTGASKITPEILAQYELSGVIRRRLTAARQGFSKSAVA